MTNFQITLTYSEKGYCARNGINEGIQVWSKCSLLKGDIRIEDPIYILVEHQDSQGVVLVKLQ